MAKKIIILVILLTVGFFCLGSNMLLAEEYTSVEDIQLDGKDAIGKKATLCIYRKMISENTIYGKSFIGVDNPQGNTTQIDIYFTKDQKELVKKIEPIGNLYRAHCTKVTIKIIAEGLVCLPTCGRLILVGE